MDELLKELKRLVDETRKNNQEQPYLSDFENGCIDGRNDVVDDIERLIKRFN